MPDGKILLDARWNLFTNDGERLLAQRRSRVVQPIEGAGYDGMAAAQSQAVEALSREIADTIRARPAKP